MSFNGAGDGASWAGSSLTFRDDGMTPDSTAVSSSVTTTTTTESSAKSQSLLSHSRRIRERQRRQLEHQFYGRAGTAGTNTIASPRPQRKSTLSLENPEELYENMEDQDEEEDVVAPSRPRSRRSRRISLASESQNQTKSSSTTRQFIEGLSVAEVTPKHVSRPVPMAVENAAAPTTALAPAPAHVPALSAPSSTVEAADSSTLGETLDHQEKIILFYKEQMDRMVDNSQRLEQRLKQVQREKDAARAQVMDAIQRLAEQQVQLNNKCEENVQLKTRVKEYQEQEQRYWRRLDQSQQNTATGTKNAKKRRGSARVQDSLGGGDNEEPQDMQLQYDTQDAELETAGSSLPSSSGSSSRSSGSASGSESDSGAVDQEGGRGEGSDLREEEAIPEPSSPEPTPVATNRKTPSLVPGPPGTAAGKEVRPAATSEEPRQHMRQHMYDEASDVYCVIGLEVALQRCNGTIVEGSPSVQEKMQAQIDWQQQQQQQSRHGHNAHVGTNFKLKHGSSTALGHKTYVAMLEHLRSKPNQQTEALDQAVLMGELKARDDNESKARLIKQRDKYATSTKSRRDDLFRQNSDPASQFIVEPMYDEEYVEAQEHRRSAPTFMSGSNEDGEGPARSAPEGEVQDLYAPSSLVESQPSLNPSADDMIVSNELGLDDF